MATRGYVKKTWSSEYITEALALSRRAWDEYVAHGRRSTDAETRKTRKLFLIGARFQTVGGTVLVESDVTGEKWGVTDFMVEYLSRDVVVEHQLRCLKQAASFGGSLYLVDLQLRWDVGHSWWAVLQRASSSTSSPHTLFILFDLVGDMSRHRGDPHLLSLQAMSPFIHNLALYKTNPFFELTSVSRTNKRDIYLQTLHVENVPICGQFLSALSERKFLHVLHTLSLVDIIPDGLISWPISDFFDLEESSIGRVVKGLTVLKLLDLQLSQLDLIGFSEKIELIPSMNSLERCPRTSLRRLSLKGSVSINHRGASTTTSTATPVGAVLDALYKSRLQFLDLGGLEQDPRIQAQLLRNRHSPNLQNLQSSEVRKASHSLQHPQHSYSQIPAAPALPKQEHSKLPAAPALQNRQHSKVPAAPALQNRQHSKVPAKSMRLFTCGDAYAGKTTLLSTLMYSAERSRPGLRVRHKVKAMLRPHAPTTLERTRGIEIHTIAMHNIRVSVWDMAGQTEFHAFHDHMFPDPSTSHGSPSMFMFVWSPMDSNTGKQGQAKSQREFESSFRYWLKFITSKTRQSNIRRKLVVVLTRKDQTRLVRDALQASIDTLSATFSDSIEVVDVLEVDARSEASVKPLLSCVFQTAQDVLKAVEVYSICSEVSEHLSKRHNRKALAGGQPIISWDDFSNLCSRQFGVTEPDMQKAIAYSLNESGDIIHLSNLPFLVLDPNWFCNEVMGSLIHFPHPENTSRAILPIDGYARQDYLEKLLTESGCSAVEGSVLLALMEAMHLCCKVPEDPQQMVFIPATLYTSSVSECLQWRGGRSSAQDYVHVGRRLECDKKESMFLTPGLFSTIQAAFNKAFLQRNDDVKLGKPDVKMGKDFMSICVQDSEILVEWGLSEGEHVIDVMMRTPNDEDAEYTLVYVEDKIIKTMIGVCAQPVGNQGVRLVEGVIRPDCLHTPSSPRVRADQCVLILDLKRELKEQLEGGRRHEKLLHLWEGNAHLQPITGHFMDLLGPKEFMQVLMSYKASLEEVSSMSATSTSGQASHAIDTQAMGEWMTEESTQVQVDENEQVVDALSRSMVQVIYRKLQSMDGKLVGLAQTVGSLHKDVDTKLDAMYKSIMHLRNDALPNVQRLVKQSLDFAVENEAGKVPRFVLLTADDRNLVTTVLRGLKHVQIELFCEHREQPHRVEKQKGLRVSTVDDGSLLQRALPYANGFLKVLTLVAKVGAQVWAGAGSAIPDLSQLVASAVHTPGFLENQGSLANVLTSPGKDFDGWRQWLVSVLEKNGGMTESNIASKFLLRRALYKDTSKVAWLCDKHYKGQTPLPLV